MSDKKLKPIQMLQLGLALISALVSAIGFFMSMKNNIQDNKDHIEFLMKDIEKLEKDVSYLLKKS